MNTQHINIVRIRTVANVLKEYKDKVVFVGGATVSLYPDREITLDIRPTDDIDVIVEILNYNQRTELEEKLREVGFSHDVQSGITCRYKVKGITVDVMPTEEASIGFTNIWYPEGYAKAIDYSLDKSTKIKILSAPYFIATKLEAFKDRGRNDGRYSKDFEDIVFILENRSTIWDEFEQCTDRLKSYLKLEFKKILANGIAFEWIDGHVERASPPQTYNIMENLRKFVGVDMSSD